MSGTIMLGAPALRLLIVAAAALVLLPLANPRATSAQTPGRVDAEAQAPAGISGVVIDGRTHEPIAGVTVTIEGQGGSAFPAAAGGFLRATQNSITNDTGEYRFPGLPPGDYRLHVQRVGYQSATAEVSFRGAADARVSFGLRVAPVVLEPVQISAVAAAVLPTLRA